MDPKSSQEAEQYFAAMGQMYVSFCKYGNYQFLNNAIRFAEECMRHENAESELWAKSARSAGSMLWERYDKTTEKRDLDNAIRLLEHAKTFFTVKDEKMVLAMGPLADCYAKRFQHTGRPEDLDIARNYITIAMGKMPNELSLHHYFTTITLSLYEYHEHADLNAALESTKLIMDSTDKDSEYMKVDNIHIRSQVYMRLDQEHPGQGHIENAWSTIEPLTERDHPNKGYFKLTAALILKYKFDAYLDIKDIEKSIELSHGALELVGDTELVVKLNNNLSLAYEALFERHLVVDNLQKAIDHSETALDLDEPERPAWWRRKLNLGNYYARLFQMKNERALLDYGIKVLQETRESNFLSPLDLKECCFDLGRYLRIRSGLDNNIADLDEAIEYVQGAYDESSEDDLYKHRYLIDISGMLERRFVKMRTPSDMTKCIERGQEAIAMLGKDHPRRPIYLQSLARSYLISFWHSQDMGRPDKDDLQKGIKKGQMSLSLMPEDHPALAETHLTLAALFEQRYMLNNKSPDKDPDKDTDREQSISYCVEAAQRTTGFFRTRVVAARDALRLLHTKSDWETMRAIGIATMDTLPILCNRFHDFQDLMVGASGLHGLAADICSICIQREDCVEGLRYLEFGRCIAIGYAVDNKSESPKLGPECADLAQKFRDLRNKLLIRSRMNASDAEEEKSISERRKAQMEMDNCLAEIRKTKGNKDFLGLPDVEQLKALASDGPIVIVNVTHFRRDAILISKSSVSSVPLPGVTKSNTPSKVQQRFRGAPQTLRSYEFPPPRDMTSFDTDEDEGEQDNSESFLQWLWESCVDPVLQALRSKHLITENDTDARVWWIGSGLAASYPFHAAGYRDRDSGSWVGTLSHVLPSYTPSLKALANARQHAASYLESFAKTDKKPRMFVVAMPTTPGQQKLPGVTEEIPAIKDSCQETYQVDVLQNQSAKEVLQKLRESHVVHFACHGSAHADDPLKTHLMLQKQEKGESKVDPLSVLQISEVLDQSVPAHLAYLSACSTAVVRKERLVEEGIHLSNMLQLVGFAHVVGSLWSLEDKVCVDMTKTFYEDLVRRSCGKQPSNRDVAMAWRTAVVKTSRSENLSPDSWAAYVHYGA